MRDREPCRIENLARRFRNALDMAREDGALREGTFPRFPRGCCGDTCDLLARYLRENGIETVCVCGTYQPGDFESVRSHAWLIDSTNNVIDITGDQFGGFSEPLRFSCKAYYGPASKFHRLFEVGECYEPARGVLFRTYDVVTNYLDAYNA